MRVGRREAVGRLAAATLGAAAPPEPAWQRGSCGKPDLTGFEPYCFTDSTGGRHQLYVTAAGDGPPVMLLHELPGLVDPDIAAARRLAEAGYPVVLPLLFGDPGGTGHAFRYARKLCGADEFACNHGQTTSPHVRWLTELTSVVRARWTAGAGVGVVGMCLTGTFPLALLRAPAVVAPVLLQPTVPFNLWTRFGWFTDTPALGLSPDDLAHAKSRTDVTVLGIRYRGDWRCRRPRFERLVAEFGNRFYRLDLSGDGHSTIGGDFCDDAFAEIVAFFDRFLRVAPDAAQKFPRLSRAGSKDEVNGAVCHDRQALRG